MDITTDNYLNINKLGDKFSFTSKLADYIINPEWKDGYNALINSEVHSNYSFLWYYI